MFDFDKDLADESEVDLDDLNAVFDALDPKVSHASPRPVQIEAWELLSARLKERDIVLKLSTGSGKTGIALVYLYAKMRSSGKPVVYLCPTRQLVRQVLREAELMGIPATEYPAKQSHPGVDALEAESIVVCTYDKLFNAKTTFKRDDVNLYPHAIVLDDAHAGIQEVRDAFTLHVEQGTALYQELLNILAPLCKGYDEADWAFLGRDPTAKMEVPYWLWADVLGDVRDAVDTHADDKPYVFVWNFLRRQLRWCRCVVSSRGIEVVPDLAPFDEVEPYADAPHRLFMSATLSDDSALVRELGCSIEAALKPVIPSKDAGVGERMVLAPTLLDPALDRAWVMSWCQELAREVSVVVLSPSEQQAREWEAVGATVELGDGMEGLVGELRTGTKSFVAFAQRYDGVDLPDEACRVLVIDGMPTGQGLVEDLDHADRKRPAGALERWVHRVEQGMGRAVRSKADYAVVLLAGKEIAHFVAQGEVRSRLGEGTRAQLDLAKDLTNRMKQAARGGITQADALRQMARQCLDRDDQWKRFYDKKVRRAAKVAAGSPDRKAVDLAAKEREAFEAACLGDYRKAATLVEEGLDEHLTEQSFKGWYLQRQANYLHAVEPGRAMELQRHAHAKNTKLFRPPLGVAVRQPDPRTLVAPKVVSDWLSSFSELNGAVLAFDLLRSKLDFSTSADKFEQALADVACMFGAEGSRPEKEYGSGKPDNMWRWADCDWIIEAKNERGTLPRKDSGQLHDSLQWHANTFPERARVPVLVSTVTKPEPDANFPADTRVITPKTLQRLLDNLQRFVAEVSAKGPLFHQPQELQAALTRHELHGDGFLNRYTVPLR